MKIYIAGSYDRKREFRLVAKKLNANGHLVMSSWIDSRLKSCENLSDEKKRQIALEDLKDLFASDCLLFFSGGRSMGGRFVELGLALNHPGKQIALIGDRENVFHYLPAVRKFFTVEGFLTWAKKEDER